LNVNNTGCSSMTLRPCSLGPELLRGALPQDIRGTARFSPVPAVRPL
jgi:hypothetical protein